MERFHRPQAAQLRGSRDRVRAHHHRERPTLAALPPFRFPFPFVFTKARGKRHFDPALVTPNSLGKPKLGRTGIFEPKNGPREAKAGSNWHLPGDFEICAPDPRARATRPLRRPARIY